MTPSLLSPTGLQTILSRGEGQFVEFKSVWDLSTPPPKPLWQRAGKSSACCRWKGPARAPTTFPPPRSEEAFELCRTSCDRWPRDP